MKRKLILWGWLMITIRLCIMRGIRSRKGLIWILFSQLMFLVRNVRKLGRGLGWVKEISTKRICSINVQVFLFPKSLSILSNGECIQWNRNFYYNEIIIYMIMKLYVISWSKYNLFHDNIFVACGRTYQANSAIFSSPSHINTKAPEEGVKCEWRIQATHGERIIVNITDLDIPKTPDCKSDYVEIRDGYWIKSPVLLKYCGSGRVHESIVSTGSRMLVTYVSKNPNGHKGFTASYEGNYPN